MDSESDAIESSRADFEAAEIRKGRLLAAYENERPDDVFERYSGSDVGITVRQLEEEHGSEGGEGEPTILIEGTKEGLIFLAELLLAQAHDQLDCGIELSPTGPGCARFLPGSSDRGIYIHLLPCKSP